MACQDYREQIHEYLDGELSAGQKADLFEHLNGCSSCKKELHDLEKTILLIQSHSHIDAPEDFTLNLMEKLPPEPKRQKFKQWLQRHPILVAASLFILLMTGSMFSVWSQGPQQLTVSAPNMDALIIVHDENKVIVPEGVVIEGDLIVQKGNVEVRGEVTGNVVVTNGQLYQASTAHILGETEEIDQFIQWIKYHTQRWLKEAIQFSN